MTIENFFVKKYEKLEAEKNELEKQVRGLEIDLSNADKVIDKLADLIKKGYPKLSAGNYLSVSIFLNNEEAQQYIDLLKKLNVKIEGEQK